MTVESFSGGMSGGWLTANAVMKYQWFEYLFLQKNITNDIARCLEPPETPEKEDLAVQFQGTDDISLPDEPKDKEV